MQFMRWLLISIPIFFTACSGNKPEQAVVLFEPEVEDSSFFNPDTTNYLNTVVNNDTAKLSLEEAFYTKYVSMYFDDENYLVITLRNGGVHFFDPHDSEEVADVLKYKKFIEFRDTLIGDNVNGVTIFMLEQKIDSLLQLRK
jgi:hypothetical protein